MITQNIGVEFLLSKALDFFAKKYTGRFQLFPGDLLLAILNIKKEKWEKCRIEKEMFVGLVRSKKAYIEHSELIDADIKQEILYRLKRFNKIVLCACIPGFDLHTIAT
ncbi:MAG: hypothetical protein JST96_05985, partial [Bacteroidetes bacterium]|nr:hypothetical protein [Bacteroidota bacterium]